MRRRDPYESLPEPHLKTSVNPVDWSKRRGCRFGKYYLALPLYSDFHPLFQTLMLLGFMMADFSPLLPHTPVLMEGVLSLFEGLQIKRFVDGTVGGGGHAAAILEAHPEIERFDAFDQDPTALELAKKKLAPWKKKVVFHRVNFEEMDQLIDSEVDGILIDCGVSSMQLDTPERGFSFRVDGPLDMRMNPDSPITAATIVNSWSEEDLGELFKTVGEEKRWWRATQAIIRGRVKEPITTTLQLVRLLEPALPPLKKGAQKSKIHPATLVFQALRIAVNKELDVLKEILPVAIGLLRPGGRLGVITFHSLEDRCVKQAFQYAASDKESTSGIGGIFIDKKPLLKLLTRKPLVATEDEIAANPRSRSAKLRGIEKLA